MNNPMKSGIFNGQIKHHRLGPAAHHFGYRMGMVGIDLDQLPTTLNNSFLLGENWYSPLRFVSDDYFRQQSATQGQSDNKTVKQKAIDKIRELGGSWQDDNPEARIIALLQCRCFGLYFSPINCYFCFDKSDHCRYLLAEVSNTPWNQRHYYLVDLDNETTTNKTFHVSPFMPMDMQYHWRIKTGDNLLVQITSHRQGKKVFAATMVLRHQPIETASLLRLLLGQPWPTLKIQLGIYYQAFKLWRKKIPFIAHPQSEQ